ncbi:outer membrane beta-barrel protein [Chryseobacterium salipaludis]|uniref:outer membrane beta-barrel protein n=1 Tax=Chryseobacterium TaxID=59732 RepID=UPI001FF629A2|nr:MULTISPECIES: outer membrane beta-barrel protein [Chryseobacterium]MCJ8497593.1 outer membrane beta-barrel protein [Chryseobacterium salipaludis]MCX3296001.1 outer membrane beta-barrel protein [Planobacterium sp. JC490]
MNYKVPLVVAALFFSQTALAQQDKNSGTKEKDIEGVVIVKTKKAVEQKADRTIFDFSEQEHLNTGSAMEGIKKLPGLIATDVAGMMYQGKLLDVYLNGRPLNISSNELTSFLEGMPANSIEKIEVITQPGAEFPASSGGAIMNIVTNKNALKYLSATYSGNYSFTNEDKFRSRTSHSLSLNARNKYFGWQLRVGQNYRESKLFSNQDYLAFTDTDRIGRGAFAKAGLTFDLGMDKLLVNYDVYQNNNDNQTLSSGSFALPGNIINEFTALDAAKTNSLRQEGVLTYQKRFDDKNRKLDFQAGYTRSNNDFYQDNIYNQSMAGGYQTLGRLLDNSSLMQVSNLKVDYSQPLRLLDEGKISFGGLYEYQQFNTSSKGITNLEYERNTAASYLELQAKLNKFDFTLGTRAENYDISGITRFTDNEGMLQQSALIPFNKFRFFPNASVQYNFMNQVYLAFNYNKKITLPSISALNPNNNTFAGPNSTVSGNPYLQPTIYDNFEVKVSAFDYAFIGYNVSQIDNQVAQSLSREGDVIKSEQVNIPDMRIHNFNIGMPIPFMIFNTPLSEIMKVNFNPDKINFVFVYAGYIKHEILGRDSKGLKVLNLMAQVILPYQVKMTANYNLLSKKAGFYYFESERPFNERFDLTFSRKFLNDKLTLSVFGNDLFNTQATQLHSTPVTGNSVFLYSKSDTRTFGLSVNYKIPTRNKLAKEDPNMLPAMETNDNGGITPKTL